VVSYPRIIICGLSFETIMKFYPKLVEYLLTHEDLAARLEQPLKTTRISNVNNLVTFESWEENQQIEPLISEGVNWDAS